MNEDPNKGVIDDFVKRLSGKGARVSMVEFYKLALDELGKEGADKAARILDLISFQKCDDVRHVVLLLHGIRTGAPWQDMVIRRIQSLEGVRVYPARYGFFDVFRFLFPIHTRRSPVKKCLEQFRYAKNKHPGAFMSAICHSFGTYIIGQILLKHPDIKLSRLILCGSVLKIDWGRVSDRIGYDVVNDCGVRDKLPALASLFSIGYAATGSEGFEHLKVQNRFHDFRHSQFFDEAFVDEYWLPYISDGTIKQPETRVDSGYCTKILGTWLARVVLYGIIVTAGYFTFKLLW